MTTAAQVMDRALKLLVVAGSESSLSADMSDDFIFAMNTFMAELESNTYLDTSVTPNVTYGVDFGWTEVETTSDVLTVSAGVIRSLIYTMAVEVAPEYGVVPSAEVINGARKGLSTMLRLGSTHRATCLPETLPIGSGNEDDGMNYGSGHFYPTE